MDRYYKQWKFFCELQEMELAKTIFSKLEYAALVRFFKEYGNENRVLGIDEYSVVESVAAWLIKNRRMRKPEHEALPIIRRSLHEALNELAERTSRWEKDERAGVRRINSLAFFRADWKAVCWPLIKAGFQTIGSVASTPDRDLLEIDGIGPEKLIQIKRAIPPKKKEESVQRRLF